MRRHRLCTSSWVGPRRAPRPGQLRARRAACGPHRPRGPGHLKLLCRLPSRPVFPWPSEGSSKTSGLLRAHPASGRLAPRGQAGSPQRPRALAKLPLPGAVSAFWCPARCPLPSQGPAGHRARVPRRPPCPFHVPATVPRGSSVMRVPKARKAPVLLVTGSGTERPLGGSDVCRPPHGRRTAPPLGPEAPLAWGPVPGTRDGEGSPCGFVGQRAACPHRQAPFSRRRRRGSFVDVVSRHAHGAASPARSDASQASASRDSSRAPREQTPAPLPPRALAGHRVGRGAGEQKGSGLSPGFSPQGTRWPWTCPPCITAARCCGTRRPCWGTASTGTSSGTARRSGGWASSDTTSQVGRRAARPRLQGARGRRAPVTEAAGREPGRFWVPWEPPPGGPGRPSPTPRVLLGGRRTGQARGAGRPRSSSWCFPEARAVTMAWGHCRPSRRSRETALPALP